MYADIVDFGVAIKVYFFVILLEGNGESLVFFRSIGESESEDPTLTETLARRLS